MRISDVSPPTVQLPLVGFAGGHPPQRRRRPRAAARMAGEDRRTGDDDPLLAIYLRRLSANGAAPKGFNAYRYQLRTLLAIARTRKNRPVTLLALFRDLALLGDALVHDRASDGRQFSRWTLAQRRSAVRSFATLMRPELWQALGSDPHGVLDRALRGVAQRVGTGYRLTGGRPRHRGGYAPDTHTVATVLAVVAQAPDFVGPRNAAFFGILAESGARVNALRELDGADCVLLPSGRLRLFLHAKGKEQAREIELSNARAGALRQYVDAYNHHARVHGWHARVRLGEPGALWRNSSRGCWSYDAVASALQDACVAAHLPAFTPHALRRAFATNAATFLPRHTIAQAGGWDGLERLDDHYIQPRNEEIWAKLGRANTLAPDHAITEEVSDAATAVRAPDGTRSIRAGPARW